MALVKDKEQVIELIREVCEREGCVLYDVDFLPGSKGKGRKVLIYIDKDPHVSIEDCERVSKGVSLLLDVQDAVLGNEYVLEVSSPGMERPLRLPWHFAKVVGEQVFVQTFKCLNEMNNLKDVKGKRFKVSGKLTEADDKSINLKTSDETFKIPLTEIRKSKLICDFDKELKQSKR